MMARKKTWSYLSGERGRNRVRVFEKRPGQFFAEWKENGKKKRALLRGVNHADDAKKKADEIAAEFGKLEDRQQAPTTVKKLVETYLEEVSVTKGHSKQQHDYRAARVWNSFFNSQPEVSRRVGRRGRRRAGVLRRALVARIRRRCLRLVVQAPGGR